jgi:hypothetical protein
MSTVHQQSAVVGLFEDRVDAERAVANLKRAGFRDDQIGLVARCPADQTDADKKHQGDAGLEGAGAGAAVGAMTGAAVGVAVLAGLIPGIGPAIAGGTLGAVLSSAGAGAVAGGLMGVLAGLGISEDDARLFEREVNAGKTLVSVNPDGHRAEAQAMLEAAGAVRVPTRAH